MKWIKSEYVFKTYIILVIEKTIRKRTQTCNSFSEVSDKMFLKKAYNIIPCGIISDDVTQ